MFGADTPQSILAAVITGSTVAVSTLSAVVKVLWSRYQEALARERDLHARVIPLLEQTAAALRDTPRAFDQAIDKAKEASQQDEMMRRLEQAVERLGKR